VYEKNVVNNKSKKGKDPSEGNPSRNLNHLIIDSSENLIKYQYEKVISMNLHLFDESINGKCREIKLKMS
jgi:hypothetical protein